MPVTFVEYVRSRGFPDNNRAVEIVPATRVYRLHGVKAGNKSGLFFGQGLIRTAKCTEKARLAERNIYGRLLPPEKTYRRNKYGNSKQKDDSHQT
jgi:hypothetical protein